MTEEPVTVYTAARVERVVTEAMAAAERASASRDAAIMGQVDTYARRSVTLLLDLIRRVAALEGKEEGHIIEEIASAVAQLEERIDNLEHDG